MIFLVLWLVGSFLVVGSTTGCHEVKLVLLYCHGRDTDIEQCIDHFYDED